MFFLVKIKTRKSEYLNKDKNQKEGELLAKTLPNLISKT